MEDFVRGRGVSLKGIPEVREHPPQPERWGGGGGSVCVWGGVVCVGGGVVCVGGTFSWLSWHVSYYGLLGLIFSEIVLTEYYAEY